MKKQHELASTFYKPETEMKAVMVIVHGMAEHRKRYDRFARKLADKGIGVLTYDQRGHGESVSDRCDLGYFGPIDGWLGFVKDLDRIIDQLKNKFDVPVVLFGHSMGSMVARSYLKRFDDKIDAMFYNYITVAITLILYGILFIVIENRNKNKNEKITSLKDISYKLAIIIGVFQVLALIPGTSRSGATIVGAILFGVSRTVAAEYTFFLAIPVMFGASLLKILKFGFAFQASEIIIILVGMLTAFVVSILAIKFLMNYIKKNDFKAFGWYRIVLGLLVLIYFLFLA